MVTGVKTDTGETEEKISVGQRKVWYGDSPVNRGIPLTNAIRKKAIFHTSFSSRSSFFQSMCMMYCVNRKCYY